MVPIRRFLSLQALKERFAGGIRARTCILALMAALLVPMLAFSAATILRFADAEREEDQQQVLSTVRALSTVMDMRLKTAAAALAALATSPALHDRDLARFFEQCQETAALHRAWLTLADPIGMPVFTTRRPGATSLPLLKSADLVKAAARTRTLQISGVFHGSFKELQVSLYFPIVSDGEVTRVLMMSFEIAELSRIIIEQDLPLSWTASIVDRSNLILARSAALDRFGGTAATASLTEAAAGSDHAAFEALAEDGTAVLGAFAKSDYSGWIAALEIPLAELYGPLHRSIREIAMAAAALLLLAITSAALIARWIGGSMRRLSVAALAIGGDEPVVLAATSIEEIDDVVGALGAAHRVIADRSRQRNIAEAALRKSEQRFRDVAEVACDWIWETHRDHRFSFISGADTGLPAASPDLILGKTRWDLAGGDPDRDEEWARHKADLDSHKPFRDLRYWAVGEDGQRRHYSVSGKPVFDETGRFVGYRGTSTNLTEVTEARERAERAETLLRDAVDSITEGFVIFDEDDRVIMRNEHLRTMLARPIGYLPVGMTFEEALRRGVHDGHYPAAIGREEPWIAERLRQHRAGEGAVELQTRDGRWMLMTDRRMRSGGIAGLRIDITELKAAQVALRASEERLDRAQQLAGIGSWELDVASGKYLWSKEMYRIRGFSRETFEPTSKGLVPYIHEDDLARARAWLNELKAGGQPAATELRMRRPDGTVRIAAVEAQALTDDKGVVMKVAGTLRDVTELRRAEEAHRDLELQLQHSQKLEALGTLAGGIAHDLNNILVPVMALSKLGLKNSVDGSRSRQNFDTIYQASLRARDLVKRILAFSRKERTEQQEFELAPVIADAVAMLRHSVPSTISLVSDLRPVPAIVGDPTQIHQVVVNLVTNAVHAIGPQPGCINVRLGTNRTSRRIRLSVSDTGCGMDDATRSRIFEPFFTTKPVGEGTGLGLSVVHGIVERHRGRIEVDSVPGKGTTFTIQLSGMTDAEAARGDHPAENAVA
jgi:PAS domain S-box-containing protein